MNETLTASRRSLSIDALRGLAATSIVGWHVFRDDLVALAPWLKAPTSVLWTGVDLFFVLSGFLIGSILIRNREKENFFPAFYGRRVCRILPMYLVLLFLAFNLGSAENPISCLLFLQNFVWSYQDRWGDMLLGPTWSLAVEEQFYLLMPFLIWFVPKRQLPYWFVGLIIAAPITRALCLSYGFQHAAYMLLPCRMDSLCLGTMLAYLFTTNHYREVLHAYRPIIGKLALIFAAGFGYFAYRNTGVFDTFLVIVGYTWIAVFFALTIAYIMLSEAKFPRVLTPAVWAGLGAYPIYLFHFPLTYVVGSAVGAINNASAFTIGTLPAYGVYASVLALVALMSWRLVEHPIIEYGHKRFKYGWQPA